MAFKFNKDVCTINIEDKLTYTIPLHEDTVLKFRNLADRMIKKLKELDPEAKESFDTAYNASMDAIDEMLGVGASEDIMGLIDSPSLFDCADLINYITEEYMSAYKKRFGEQKKTADIPKKGGRRA